MNTQVSQLYVALFGRAPDAEGLQYWASLLGAGQTPAAVADVMFGTAPARSYFPAGLSNEQIIASFYLNVLGRPADGQGLAHWTAKLNAAGASPGLVIAEMIAVIAGYSGSDPAGIASAALFNNRVAVAQSYAEHNGSLVRATSVLSSVTSDPLTVAGATTYYVPTNASGTHDVSGYEIVSVGALGANTTLANAGGDVTLHFRASTGNITNQNGAWIADQTLTLLLAENAGFADHVALEWESNGTMEVGALRLPGVESIDLRAMTTTGFGESTLLIEEASMAHLVITGNDRLYIVDYSGIGFHDGLAATGQLTIRSDQEYVFLRGGSAADVLFSPWAGTLSGGAGADRLYSAGGATVFTGGPGRDTFSPGLSESRDQHPVITDFSRYDYSFDYRDVLLLWDLIGTALSIEWHTAAVGTGPSLDALLDAAASATNGATTAHVHWFQWGGNTYLTVDRSNATTFQDGVDQIVGLTGLIDLSYLTLTWNVPSPAYLS